MGARARARVIKAMEHSMGEYAAVDALASFLRKEF